MGFLDEQGVTVGKNSGVGDVQEVESHDHNLLWQVCLVEQPLDLVFLTKIWTQQRLTADKLQTHLGFVQPAFHELAVGNSEGDRRGAAVQGPRTQQSLGHQASCVHKDLDDPLLAGTAYPADPEMHLAMFADLCIACNSRIAGYIRISLLCLGRRYCMGRVRSPAVASSTSSVLSETVTDGTGWLF